MPLNGLAVAVCLHFPKQALGVACRSWYPSNYRVAMEYKSF